MTRYRLVALALVIATVAFPGAALAQKSVADVFGRQATPEGQPKSYLEEVMLFAYIENSYVWNLGNASRGGTNDLRFYDFDKGYTFNVAEFSLKKDPSERYPFGYGVVLTAGIDSQKNHALGMFRGDNDQFAFRNTTPFDLQEAYASYKIPARVRADHQGGEVGDAAGLRGDRGAQQPELLARIPVHPVDAVDARGGAGHAMRRSSGSRSRPARWWAGTSRATTTAPCRSPASSRSRW